MILNARLKIRTRNLKDTKKTWEKNSKGSQLNMCLLSKFSYAISYVYHLFMNLILYQHWNNISLYTERYKNHRITEIIHRKSHKRVSETTRNYTKQSEGNQLRLCFQIDEIQRHN